MRLIYILKALGLILKAIALVMLVPIIVALIYKEYLIIGPFIASSIFSFLLGSIMSQSSSCLENINDIKKTEALLITALAWMTFGLVAAVPYLSCDISLIDSLFEAFSGITTTGATIINDYSIYPHALFFWRSFTQWLGGMGIIVLFIAVLPQFAVAGRQMFFTEAPGPTEQKITPRIRNTANYLWKIYVILTLLEIIILKYLGMPLFPAICNSLSTLAAGGLSPEATSFINYSTPIIWTVFGFMFLSGVSFPLIYNVIAKKNILLLWKDEEFKTYTAIIGILTLLIALILFLQSDYSFATAIRDSAFQVVSFLTTTGFVNVDYNNWTFDAKMFLFILFFIGGCSGSAAGGLKVIRAMFVWKLLKREISRLLHPNGIYNIKINRVIFPEDVNKQITAFVMFYFAIFAISAFLVILIEKNIVIGFTGAIATLGNVGPAFGALAPSESFSGLSTFSKIIFIINMVVGRLELIPFLAMLHPDFWILKK